MESERCDFAVYLQRPTGLVTGQAPPQLTCLLSDGVSRSQASGSHVTLLTTTALGRYRSLADHASFSQASSSSATSAASASDSAVWRTSHRPCSDSAAAAASPGSDGGGAAAISVAVAIGAAISP